MTQKTKAPAGGGSPVAGPGSSKAQAAEALAQQTLCVGMQIGSAAHEISIAGMVAPELAADGAGMMDNAMDRMAAAMMSVRDGMGSADTAAVAEGLDCVSTELCCLSDLIAQISQAAQVTRKTEAVSVNINLSSGQYGLQVAISRLQAQAEAQPTRVQPSKLLEGLEAAEGLVGEISDLLGALGTRPRNELRYGAGPGLNNGAATGH